MYIGDKIKELRQARNLTQQELSQILSVTKSAISAYENNIRVPSIDILIKISLIFHVTLDNILGVGVDSTYSIDVTELTNEQRNMIQDIVNAYKLVNRNFTN